jgi:hypothetical protein
MTPFNPWLAARSISIAGLAAIALALAYFVYMTRIPAAAALGIALQLVLPPVILFLLCLAIDRRFRIAGRLLPSYNYRTIGIVFYIVLAIAVALARRAIGHFGTGSTIILLIGGLLPGILLTLWRMLHKIAGPRV